MNNLISSIFRKPDFLIFFITNPCNFKCDHCLLESLPKELNKKELNIVEINKIAENLPKIRHMSITGGEPFLRLDLLEILKAFITRNKIGHFTIITNGWYQERIFNVVTEVLKTKIKSLSIRISIDGQSKVHDSIRNQPGSFSKARETLKSLESISKTDKRFSIGTITTFQQKNKNELRDLLKQLKEVDLDTTSLNLVREASKEIEIKTQSDLQIFSHTYQQFQKNNKSKFRRSYKKVVLELLLKIENFRSCRAGSLIGVLRETGEVYPCEILDTSMGNIRNYDYKFKRLWSSKDSKRIRNKTSNCKVDCTYECVMPYNIVSSKSLFSALLKNLFSKKT